MLRAKATKIEVTRHDVEMLDSLRQTQYDQLAAMQMRKENEKHSRTRNVSAADFATTMASSGTGPSRGVEAGVSMGRSAPVTPSGPEHAIPRNHHHN